MADISEWSPVDESNNQPPPNGWPEGMAPSAVNNSARAIMGAVRRHHDQIIDGSLELPYLKLTGGSVSGPVTVSGIITGQNSIEVTGSNAAFVFSDRDGVSADWMWYANFGAAHLWHGGNIVTVTPSGLSTGGTVTAAQLTSTANIAAAGTVTATGGITGQSVVSNSYITAIGNMFAAGYYCDGALIIDTASGVPVFYKAGGGLAMQLQSAATYYDNDAHYFRNSGGISTLAIDAAGNVNASAEVQGATLYSRGGISAAGNISAAVIVGSYVQSTSTVYANGDVSGNYIISRGAIDSTGNITCGGDFTSNAGYSNINAIQPRAEHDGFVGRAGLSYDSMSCWNYITVSDRRHKSDIEVPTGCLDVVKAVPPRTYKWADGKDPDIRHWGLIAQEVGEAAGRDFSGRLIDPETGQERLVLNEVFALLWGAVRELSAEVAALREVANAR